MQDPTRRPWAGPLGALTWNISLRLWEWLQLRREPWWRPLQRAVKKEFRHLDARQLVLLHSPEGPGSLSDGDTPSVTVVHLLRKLALPPGSQFVDLGSGRGLPCLTAAALGYPSQGLELFQEYAEGCNRIALNLKLPAQFQQADIAKGDWPPADLYWLASSSFTETFRSTLQERLLKLPIGSRVVTLDWPLSPPFEVESVQVLPTTWGSAQFFTHRFG